MCIIHLRLITVYSHLCSHIYTFTVPSRKVEKYLKSKGCVVQDASEADRSHFSSFSQVAGNPINVSVFRGQGHGDWPLDLSSNQLVARAAGYLVEQIK
mmetsp:Transcript_4528/g.9387  ORF Transcript_4528/g.9387 Transcript_4528/m.9387 type:complete len:98 (-) Transcript_4528:576-869(-)